VSIFSTKNGGSKAHDGIFYPLKRRIKECHYVGKRMPKLPFGDGFLPPKKNDDDFLHFEAILNGK